MLETFANYVFLFFLFSMVGWTMETTYRSLGEQKIINTGFLFGPMCPIYGTGALVFQVFLTPFSKYWWAVLLLGMVLADTVEYLTSFIMEKLFNARWWDYTEEFLNLHGRICLKHTCYWALASFIYVYFVSPVYSYLICFIPMNVRYVLLGIIFTVFAIDLVFTVRAALGIQKIMRSIDSLKASITLATDSVKTTVENLRDDAEFRYDDLINAIAGSPQKFTLWKNDVSQQFGDIKKSIEEMGRKNSTMVGRRVHHLYATSRSIRSAADKKVKEIESKIDELKSKLDNR